MDRAEFINRLKIAGFDDTEYVVTAGGAMLLHGIRHTTRDIDLSCSAKLADELESRGFKTSTLENGRRRIELAEDFEIYEESSLPEFVVIDDIPTMTIDAIIAMKKRLGREKDFRDLELIEKQLTR